MKYGFFQRISSILFLVVSIAALGQDTKQTIRGRVFDQYSREPLIGATVILKSGEVAVGTVTDVDGSYKLEVPVGRQIISCQFIGYLPQELEVMVNSSKTSIQDFFLNESVITTEDVVVTAYRRASDPVNELAVVSARSFTSEETERYAASVNDPGRMALSYPGVNQGGDEAENDIIIRGNSSRGMLRRLEDIDISNPNHFARPGTSGGGVTVFSAQLLSKSDFFTGGMPAGYGNALSGAFDVHFRAGNMVDREHRVKLGLLGLDYMTEGPINEGNSSYLVNYRYSTLGILTNMGVYLVGERVTNEFQDLSFNNSFILPNGKDVITVFGIGGLSQEHYQPVANASDRTPGVANEWEDRVRTHNMGAIGMTYTKTIDESSYFKWVIAGMGNYQRFVNDTLDLNDNRYNYGNEEYLDWRISSSMSYNKRFSPKTRLKTGMQFSQVFYDFFREENQRGSTSSLDPNIVFGVSLDGQDKTQIVQAYAQVTHQVNDKLSLNVGGNAMAFTLNQRLSLDPRLSLVYDPHPQHSLRLAAGRYSQVVPLGAFFYRDAQGNTTNDDLELMKAFHYIFSYRLALQNNWIINLEVYLQSLSDVPTLANGDEEYWLLNSQSGFPTFALNSEGTGKNMGIDLALEKHFSGGFYLLATGSLFESTYTANGGPSYNSNFNTKFSSSYTLAKEWSIKGRNTLQIGGRVLYNGGYRFTPLDEAASLAAGTYVPLANHRNAGQVDPYFRIDSRIQYRINGKRAVVWSLDIQNTTNRFNPRGMTYNAVTNVLEFQTYVGGLVPVLSYQIDF
jgi:hypothetical protein